MPDHAPRARHTPPWLWDRARTNVLSLIHTGLSVAGGGLIAIDALVPDGRWLASHSLAMIPEWVQVLIAVLLVAGGVVTTVGVLIRHIRLYSVTEIARYLTRRRRSRRDPERTVEAPRPLCDVLLAPLTTILLERVGWLMLTFGWGTTAVAVIGNGRLGSTLALVTMIALALGALCKVVLLWQLEREVRQEITARKVTTDALRRLGEA